MLVPELSFSLVSLDCGSWDIACRSSLRIMCLFPTVEKFWNGYAEPEGDLHAHPATKTLPYCHGSSLGVVGVLLLLMVPVVLAVLGMQKGSLGGCMLKEVWPCLGIGLVWLAQGDSSQPQRASSTS